MRPHNLPLFLRAKQDGRADAFLLCLASVYHRQMRFSITKRIEAERYTKTGRLILKKQS